MADEKELKVLRGKRGSIKGQVTCFSKYFDKIQIQEITNDIIDQLKLRLGKIETLWETFDNVQMDIETVATEVDIELMERENFQDTYFSLITAVNRFLAQYNDSQENQEQTRDGTESIAGSVSSLSLRHIKLPTIKLPSFGGDFSYWREFYDTFKALIHNNAGINDSQKMCYLRSSLTGDAASVISSFEISETNYKIAWELLEQRYNNVRRIVLNHSRALLEMGGIQKESHVELRKLIDTTQRHLRCLQSLEQPVESWGALLVPLIASKLDAVTNKEWEQRVNSSDSSTRDQIPTVEELMIFLSQKHDTMESIVSSKSSVGSIQSQGQNSKSTSNTKGTRKTFLASNTTCFYCDGTHVPYTCPEFLKLSVDARCDAVNKQKLCINCFRNDHYAAKCQGKPCKICHRKHHTLLHWDRQSKDKTESQDHGDQTSALSSQLKIKSTQVLLATAIIQVLDSRGKYHNCRALLDSGSQSNFITTELCNKLQIKRIKTHISVVGINMLKSNSQFNCEVTLKSRDNGFSTKISCLIMPKICDKLPGCTIDISTLKIPSHIKLADPEFNKPGQIDLLLGADLFWKLLCVGQIKLGTNQPILQKTRLGYVISGSMGECSFGKTHCNFTSNLDIQGQLERFWEIEEYSEKKVYSSEEMKCEQHFRENVERNSEGRFVVTIPFKDSLEKLGNSLAVAKRRFYSLEKKLQRNHKLKEQYVNFMEEYITLGHMSLVKEVDSSKPVFYMPHHGVIREDSATTKLRVVFDGSCLSSSGVSLNQLQMVGPTIQDELITILLRFRQHPIVIAADIAKMYRQILVQPEQRSLQLIFWRSDFAKPLQSYELNTVTYGTSSAPFLAIRCLKELANQNIEQFPLTSKIISDDFYVDDLLTGANSIEEATIICEQITSILKQGCFELRKWQSNQSLIFKDFPNYNTQSDMVNLGVNENCKTLGVYWSSQDDKLAYKIEILEDENIVTKRTILSSTAQIFDPLGLLSACTVIAKLILQKLWLEKISWDETVPMELHTRWLKFRRALVTLNDLTIPRHAMCTQSQSVELHCFSDASELAYGACIYVRSTDQHGKINVQLLCAKSKVAPLKILSIPRLELSGALISARLADRVIASLTVKFDGVFYWSDSNIVLAWIKTPSNLLKTFVGNRVAEIQQKTNINNWNHVSSGENPADILSRGMDPILLQECNIWWNGPSWLSGGKYEWSNSEYKMVLEIPELKAQTNLLVNIYEFELFSRYSSLNKLKRVTAYCLRFYFNAKGTNREKSVGPLTASEQTNALKALVKVSQGQCFGDDLAGLKQQKKLNSRSKLLSFNPFVDSEGLLRVGGRLSDSDFEFEKCHPIILSADHPLTYLIMVNEHVRLLHCGAQALLSSIRETYWPCSGKNLAKKVVRQCISCFRNKPKTRHVIMGNLPRERITPTHPFMTTGVDYAGPLLTRDRRVRGYKTYKSYICLFVCFVTKAVHLELVSDLTSECFLAALRRFTSRRGKPAFIHSENGTNFVGANNELQILKTFLLKHETEIVNDLAADNITWKFIPPHSPHFGGLWEAGVKSVKHHLKRVLMNALLTFEDLYTVLTQIESVLNSRPISPLSTDPNDLNPLTPAHFLIGRTLTGIPDPSVLHIKENKLSRFQKLQQLNQHFWKRWSKEYLGELQLRTKWAKGELHLKEGDMVLIKEENLPPLSWKIGRITALHPGLDGAVRVVSILTSRGVLKRSITKICPFPEE